MTVAVTAVILLLLSFPALAAGKLPRIGLIVPMSGARKEEGLGVRRGVEMAVAEANANGRRYELVTRTDDGLWGKGVQQVAKLAFDDRVCGILGGITSDSGHIIEQVAMKARIPFVTPWAGDRTLTAAGVPFVFRCVPDDLQQAHALSRLAFGQKRMRRVGILVTDDRSARRAAAVFAMAAQKAGHPIPPASRWLVPDVTGGGRPANLGRNVPVPGTAVSESTAVAAILRARPNGVIVFGPPATASHLAVSLGRASGVQVVSPESVAPISSGFRKAFRARFGIDATAPAAYAYDSARVLLRAIEATRKTPGPPGDVLRQAILKTKMAGATGLVAFDKRGNRRG